jgi:hypothetical protein
MANWELKEEDLPTSCMLLVLAGAGPAKMDEICLMEMMALKENDGTYQIETAHQEGNVLW